LQELYTWGDLAFVGGSFKDKVHSVMEPLCVGIPVVVGPHHSNNREALHFQHVILGTGFFAVTPIQNSNDLRFVMEKALSLPSPHPLIRQKVNEASGATARLMKWIESSL
jgi:3-deoxy-D-manno-octulosonic-acid transferase